MGSTVRDDGSPICSRHIRSKFPVYFFFFVVLDGVLVDIVFAAPLALVSPIEVSFCVSLPGEVAAVEVMGFMVEAGADDGDDDGGVALELLIVESGRGVSFLGDLEEEEEDDGGVSSEAKTEGGGGGGRRLRASSGSS